MPSGLASRGQRPAGRVAGILVGRYGSPACLGSVVLVSGAWWSPAQIGHIARISLGWGERPLPIMGPPFSTRLRYDGGEKHSCGVAAHRFWSWTILGQSDYDSTDAARVLRAPCAAMQGKCACFFVAHRLLGRSASISCPEFIPPSVGQVKSELPMDRHPRFL